MPAVKSSTPKSKPAAVSHIHGLLQTMRVIQQHEDQFCTLMHAVERAGKLSAADSRELHKLLDQMPAQAFQHDLDAVRASLLPSVSRPAAPSRKAAVNHAH